MGLQLGVQLLFTSQIMSKSRTQSLKDDLLDLLEYTSSEEPQLYERLDEMWKWIKKMKDGLLMSKNHVLNLFEEVIQDSIFWLEYQTLSVEDQEEAVKNLSTSRQYWSLELFPLWFREPDPKLNLWKSKMLKGDFHHLDEQAINSTCEDIRRHKGSTHSSYVLDLSMATDLIAASASSKPLTVQLTTVSGDWLHDKTDQWKETLSYWQIKHGLLLSYNPSKVGSGFRAYTILQKCGQINSPCYDVCITNSEM